MLGGRRDAARLQALGERDRGRARPAAAVSPKPRSVSAMTPPGRATSRTGARSTLTPSSRRFAAVAPALRARCRRRRARPSRAPRRRARPSTRFTWPPSWSTITSSGSRSGGGPRDRLQPRRSARGRRRGWGSCRRRGRRRRPSPARIAARSAGGTRCRRSRPRPARRPARGAAAQRRRRTSAAAGRRRRRRAAAPNAPAHRRGERRRARQRPRRAHVASASADAAPSPVQPRCLGCRVHSGGDAYVPTPERTAMPSLITPDEALGYGAPDRPRRDRSPGRARLGGAPRELRRLDRHVLAGQRQVRRLRRGLRLLRPVALRRGRHADARDDGAGADPRARESRRGRRRPPLLHGHPGPGALQTGLPEDPRRAPNWSPSRPTSSAAPRSATCRRSAPSR